VLGFGAASREVGQPRIGGEIVRWSQSERKQFRIANCKTLQECLESDIGSSVRRRAFVRVFPWRLFAPFINAA
jgi:hypothetical protein